MSRGMCSALLVSPHLRFAPSEWGLVGILLRADHGCLIKEGPPGHFSPPWQPGVLLGPSVCSLMLCRHVEEAAVS